MKSLIRVIFLGSLMTMVSTHMYGSEEWWLVAGDTKECIVPPAIKGKEISPHLILKTIKSCKVETLENTNEVVIVKCKDTSYVFTTTLKACNEVLKILKKK